MPAPEPDSQTARIEAFSDGVFSIIITLLVFSITVPSHEALGDDNLLQALLQQWPMYLAFSASFFFVLVMWINHHRLFTVIRRSDNNLMLLNGLLLFGISLVPFPTAVVAQYLDHQERTAAVLVYTGWFLVISIFFNVLWAYASHKGRLFSPKTDLGLVNHIARQYAFGPVFYLGAMLLVFVHPFLSLAATIGLAIFFAIPNKDVNKLMQTAD